MVSRSVYLITSLSLDGRPVACRYSVAFLSAHRGHKSWYVVVYDPASRALCTESRASFRAQTSDGDCLTGSITPGEPDADRGVHYLEGDGLLTIEPGAGDRTGSRPLSAPRGSARAGRGARQAGDGPAPGAPDPAGRRSTIRERLLLSRPARAVVLVAVVVVVGLAAFAVVDEAREAPRGSDEGEPAAQAGGSPIPAGAPVVPEAVSINGIRLDDQTTAILRRSEKGSGWSVRLRATGSRPVVALPPLVVLGVRTSSDVMLRGVARVGGIHRGSLVLTGIEPLHETGGPGPRD